MDELTKNFQEEALDHVSRIEAGILSLEKDPVAIDSVFRSIHSIKGSANMLGLHAINRLSHKLESILDHIRTGRLQVEEETISCLLAGVDGLKELLADLETANRDIAPLQNRLDHFLAARVDPAMQKKIGGTDSPEKAGPLVEAALPKNQKILIIEDERTNRTLLEEAIRSYHRNVGIISVDSAAEGLYYYLTGRFDLVFLDIMMPRLDGNDFIEIVEINKKAGHLQHTANIVVQTAIQSIDRLTLLAGNECVQEIIKKPISVGRIQECVYRYCVEPYLENFSQARPRMSK